MTENLKLLKEDIISDFSSAYYKLYMREGWGIENSCPEINPELIWLKNWMLEWQLLEDCCQLCIESKKPKDIVATAYPEADATGCTYPFAVSVCGAGEECSYAGLGDFNGDFNRDFFK